MFKNAVLCACFGDALGLPNELPDRIMERGSEGALISYKRKTGGKYFPTLVDVARGTISDDSQSIIMVLRSLQFSNWIEHFYFKELPQLPSYGFGVGSATKDACKVLLRKKYPWDAKNPEGYYNAGGNGGAMRILPHIFKAKTIEELMEDIQLNTIATHGHPVGIIGAMLYGYALKLIYDNPEVVKDKFDFIMSICQGVTQWGTFYRSNEISQKFLEKAPAWWQGVWDKTACEVCDLLLNSLEIGSVSELVKRLKLDGELRGSAVLCAVGCAVLSGVSDMEGTLFEVASYQGLDTDTMASMLGAMYGLRGYSHPEVVLIQGYDYIVSEVDAFMTSDSSMLSPDMKIYALSEVFRHTEQGYEAWTFPFGNMKVEEIIFENALSSSFEYMIRVCSTEIGQTLRVKQIRKV
jgi:ADP-ribosylglycohydrolase